MKKRKWDGNQEGPVMAKSDLATARFVGGLPAIAPLQTRDWTAHSERASAITRVVLFLLVFLSPGRFAWAQKSKPDLCDASLDTLMNLEVTSVAKKEQKLSQTAGAIFVITQEDIRRSGVTSIPELLRMAPGLDVAQIDANKWAISARGLNERFADKMLVLIDGRTVFTPLFAGVYWDVQDTLLEDIERIEVIRGPGATLWGANAVNGVINIITKHAKATQGGLVTAGTGSLERGFGAARYGGKFGPNADYRFFTKYFDRGDLANSAVNNASDGWHVLRGGFRTDWKMSGIDSLTVLADIYNGRAGQQVTTPLLTPPFSATFADRTKIAGGNVLGRWNHFFSDRSDTTLQLYYDRTDRSDTLLGEVRHTFDLDFDHHFAAGSRHDILWGLGYRFTTDQTTGSLSFSFNPSSRGTNLYSTFVQDEIALYPGWLRLTVGTKLEHNAYSGLEVQPNIRLLWTPHQNHAIWAAISRAVENTPRLEANGRVNDSAFRDAGGTTNLVSSFGNPHLPAESVLARELGYRTQLRQRLSLDLAAFYNVYSHLHTDEPGVPFLESSPSPPHLVLPTILGSKMHGETHGIEIAANWNVTTRWSLSTDYTWLRIHLHPDPSSLDSSTEEIEGESPKRQYHLRSRLNLPANLEFDTSLYYVSRLSGIEIPSYTRLDSRLGWRPARSLEISVALQNLLDPRHPEFDSSEQLVNSSQVKRSVYGKVTWRF